MVDENVYGQVWRAAFIGSDSSMVDENNNNRREEEPEFDVQIPLWSMKTLGIVCGQSPKKPVQIPLWSMKT